MVSDFLFEPFQDFGCQSELMTDGLVFILAHF